MFIKIDISLTKTERDCASMVSLIKTEEWCFLHHGNRLQHKQDTIKYIFYE